MERLAELRRPELERKKRADVRARRERIVPQKFLMVASSEQVKRSLADVLGRYYRKVNGRVYPSVALFVKEKNSII
jgi:hypothetical protein